VKLLRFSVAAAVAAIIIPIVPSASDVVHAAVPRGASAYNAVNPARLADTRADQPGSDGFTRLSADTIRVQVTGRAGIPTGASAAVLNITSVNAQRAAFVTAYPAGNQLPTASSLNVDVPGRIIGNLATVQLSASGAVELYTNQPMDLVVDAAGAYTPVADSVSAGRLFTIPGGAQRVLDTRDGGGPVPARGVRRVSLDRLDVPPDATGVVFNLAATEGGSGFWTAYPVGVDRPLASSLYIDEVGQTRNGQGIVALSPGERAFDVFSFGGGHLIVDVVGWFTGADQLRSTEGLFVPSSPVRMRDTRHDYAIAPWGGSTIEFSSGADLAGLGGQVAAVAMNLAIAEPLNVGFVTAFPAGVSRPLAANLNVSALDQIISNHATVRVGQRGVSLFTQAGTHMIVDITGWYLGTADASVLPPPVNPSTATTRAIRVDAPSGRIATPIRYGADIDGIVNAGNAVLYGGNGIFGGPDHNIFFAHRTSAGGPFYYMDRIQLGHTFSITGADGRRYIYLVTDKAIINPSPAELIRIAVGGGPVTATIVACHPLHSTRQRYVVTGRLIGLEG
jgi:sortase (surface protein transpeptidase)